MSNVTHTGSCHCGAIRFEVEAPRRLVVNECNCSMCKRLGYWHLIVPVSRFRLLSGEAQLQSYQFNTGVANHLFCSICGIKSFYVPRSHPEGISVNARCLDSANIDGIEIIPFDGANWEDNISQLPPLTD